MKLEFMTELLRGQWNPAGHAYGRTKEWLAALDDFRNWLIREAA
jgi:hypothetical protein